MYTINKKQAIKTIKESTDFHATIEYIQNPFTMSKKGDLMEKQEKVSLDSI